MPCKLVIKHPALEKLMGKKEFTSMLEYQERIRELRNTKITMVFEGKETSATIYNLEAGILMTSLGNVDMNYLEINGFHFDDPKLDDVELSDPAGRIEEHGQQLPDTLELGELPERRQDTPNAFVKLEIFSTTTQEVEGRNFKDDEVNRAQRSLIQMIENNRDDYELIAIHDDLSRPFERSEEVEGEVLLLVKKGPGSWEDRLVRIDNKVYPLNFEAPLSSTLETNSFFGNRKVEEVSRTPEAHQRRLEARALRDEITPEQADEIYKSEFKQLQKIRKRLKSGEVLQMDIRGLGDGFYRTNVLPFAKLAKSEHKETYIPVSGSIQVDKEGEMTVILSPGGQDVEVPVFATKLSQEEIDDLKSKLDNYSEHREYFDMLLGTRKPAKNSFFDHEGRLFFHDGDSATSVTLDNFENLISVAPYRNKPINMAALIKTGEGFSHPKYESPFAYFLNEFYPAFTFYWDQGLPSASPANRYVEFSEPTQIKVDVFERLTQVVAEKSTHTINRVPEGTIIHRPGSKVILSSDTSLDGLSRIIESLGYEVQSDINKQILELQKIGIIIANGFYDPKTNEITLAEGADQETTLEEQLHALTARYIEENPEDPDVQELIKLYEEVKEWYTGDDPFVLYTLSDVYEFVARGLSNPHSVEAFKEFGPSNWKQKLATVISRILKKLGIDVPSYTYARLLDFVDSIQVEQEKVTKPLDDFFPTVVSEDFLDFSLAFSSAASEVTLDVEDPLTRLNISEALDTMLAQVMFESYSVLEIQRKNLRPSDLANALPKVIELYQPRTSTERQFIEMFKAAPNDMVQAWMEHSKFFNKKVTLTVESDDERTLLSEQGENITKGGWDRKGNEDMAFTLVDNAILTLLSTLPSTETTELGFVKLRNPKEVYYEVLDAVDGKVTMEEFYLQLLSKFPEIAKRVPVSLTRTGLEFPTDATELDLVSKFYQSFHKPSLPFMVQVEMEDGELLMIQQTKTSRQAVKAKAVSNFLGLKSAYHTNTPEGRVASKLWFDDMKEAIDSGDWVEFFHLMGLNIKTLSPAQFSQLQSQMNNLKPQWTRLINSQGTVVDPITDLSNNRAGAAGQRGLLNSVLDQIGEANNFAKTRMVLGPDGQPVSSDTLPNSMTQLVDMYNNMPDDPGPEYGFLRNPLYKNSLSARRFANQDRLRLYAFGGKEGKGISVKLNPKDWITMNLNSFGSDGLMEIMRTETSSSSWSFKFQNTKFWVNSKEETLSAFKGYFRGELTRMAGNENADWKFYLGNNFVLFDYLPDNVKLEIVRGLETVEDIDALTEELWPMALPAVESFLLAEKQEIVKAMQEYGVVEDDISPSLVERYGIENLVELFSYNYIVQNIEESILFNGGIEWYKDFHKRAKGKISTGSTPIPDEGWYESVSTDGTLADTSGFARPYTPWLKTMNVKDQIIGYKKEAYSNIKKRVLTSLRSRLKKIGLKVPGLTKLVDTKLAAYKEMEVGDGQGWVNMDYYRLLHRATGNWSTKDELLYQWEVVYYKKNILGKPLSRSEQETLLYRRPNHQFAPSKHSYFGPDKVIGAPVFDKFSLAPLLPSVVHGTKWESVMKNMVEADIAYLKHTSGTKAALARSKYMGPVDVFEEDLVNHASTYEVYAPLMKEQLRTDNNHKKVNIFGSQFRKLVFQDIMERGMYIDTEYTQSKVENYLNSTFKGKTREARLEMVAEWFNRLPEKEKEKRSPFYKRYKKYKRVLDKLTQLEKESLYLELGIKETKDGIIIEDYNELVKTLVAKSGDQAHTVVDFLALNLGSEGNLNIPLESSTNRQVFDTMINSFVTKRVGRQKVPGGKLIQLASTGFVPVDFVTPTEKEFQKYSATGLKYYHDGRPAEVKISMHGPFLNLLKRADVIELAQELQGDSDIPVEKFRLQALNQLLGDERWIEANGEVVRMVAYRIPTQGLSSMEVFRVREFLPPSAGKVLIPPMEIVAKSGSDFDIDTLSTLVPHIDGQGNLLGPVPTKFDEAVLEKLKNERKSLNREIRSLENMPYFVRKEVERLEKLGLALLEELTEQEFAPLMAQIEAATQALIGKIEDEKLAALIQRRMRVETEINWQYIAKKGPKPQLQNQLLEIISEQILDPLNEHQLLTPLGTDIIKPLLQENGNRVYGNTADPRGMEALRFRSNLNKRIALLTGKDLLGIAALANTFVQLYNKGNVRVKAPRLSILTKAENKRLRENGFIALSSQYSLDGVMKSEVFNQHVNGTVDAAKEDYMGFANYNRTTMAPMMTGILLGIPYKRLTDLIDLPSVRALVNEKDRGTRFAQEQVYVRLLQGLFQAGAGRKMTPEDLQTEHENADARLATSFLAFSNGRYFIPQKNLSRIGNYFLKIDLSEITTADKLSFGERGIKSPKFYKRNIAGLVQFQELEKTAGDLFLLQNKLNFDTALVKSPTDAYLKAEDRHRVLPNVEGAETVYENTEISSLYIMDEYLQILDQLYQVLYSDGYFAHLADMLESIDPTQKDRAARKAANDFVEYLIKSRKLRGGKSLGQWGWSNLNDVLEPPESIKNLKFFQDLGRIYINGLPMLYLRRDTSDKAISNVYTADLRKAHSLEPEYTQKLVELGFLQTGFNKTYYSWSDVIPPELLTSFLTLDAKPTQEELMDFFGMLNEDGEVENSTFLRENPEFQGGQTNSGYKYRFVLSDISQDLQGPIRGSRLSPTTEFLINRLPFTLEELRETPAYVGSEILTMPEESANELVSDLLGRRVTIKDDENINSELLPELNRILEGLSIELKGGLTVVEQAQQVAFLKDVPAADFHKFAEWDGLYIVTEDLGNRLLLDEGQFTSLEGMSLEEFMQAMVNGYSFGRPVVDGSMVFEPVELHTNEPIVVTTPTAVITLPSLQSLLSSDYLELKKEMTAEQVEELEYGISEFEFQSGITVPKFPEQRQIEDPNQLRFFSPALVEETILNYPDEIANQVAESITGVETTLKLNGETQPFALSLLRASLEPQHEPGPLKGEFTEDHTNLCN